MSHKVGDVYNLGSESHIRAHGLRAMGIDGSIETPSIGHKGQEGSDPNFSDYADHVTTVTAVEPLEQGSRITRRCSCGLIWSWTEKGEG